LKEVALKNKISIFIFIFTIIIIAISWPIEAQTQDLLGARIESIGVEDEEEDPLLWECLMALYQGKGIAVREWTENGKVGKIVEGDVLDTRGGKAFIVTLRGRKAAKQVRMSFDNKVVSVAGYIIISDGLTSGLYHLTVIDAFGNKFQKTITIISSDGERQVSLELQIYWEEKFK
jgi:hypothetical protein